MQQAFELIQSNTGKLLLMWMGGLALVTAVAIGGSVWLLAGAGPAPVAAWLGVVVLGGAYGLHRLGKTVSAVPTRVTVSPDRLTIYLPRSGEETPVPFAQLAAYRASRYNGAEALRLTLKDGRKMQIKINNQLHNGQDFAGMVAAFEAALGHYQQASGPAAAVQRERSFFEKPVSSWVFGAFTAALAWVGWFLATGPHPVKSSLFVALGSYISYATAWHGARARRNQPDGINEAVR